MCGICGVVQVGGAPRRVVATEVLDWMTDLMTHRGPNERGTYEDDGVALGVRRVCAVQNGELYNHGDVRGELAADGHRLATRCDSEVIPHLYERYGSAFPE